MSYRPPGRGRARRPIAAVIVSNYPFPTTSGGRKRAVRLLEAMERGGLEPRLLVADPGGVTEEQIELALQRDWAVERYEHSAPGWRRPVHHLRPLGLVPSRALARRLDELARGRRVALIQAEERLAAAYLTQVPPGTVPTILSTHNVDSELFGQRAAATAHPVERLRWRHRARRRHLLERHLARRCAAVLCVSEHDRGHFADAGAGASALLAANGVDDELFEICEPGPLEHVLFFGQLSYPPNAEGLERFLSAWPAVSRARPAARLRIAGADPPPGLRARAGSLDRVDVLGFVDDLSVELSACRLVIAPLWQGGGTRMKVLEAMAAGRPVAGTPIGVERIGFRPGVHGEEANDPGGLAAAVVSLLGSPERAVRQGAEARRHAVGFRWSQTLSAPEELYRKIATSTTRPSKPLLVVP